MQYHGPDARLELGGRRIFVAHYPEYGYALAAPATWMLGDLAAMRFDLHTLDLWPHSPFLGEAASSGP